MLRHLRLKNLVLVDSCEIALGPGLNIISGETGAGKTALTSAIGLILGQRADLSSIRKGEDLAIVEAAFDIQNLPEVQQLLEKSHLDFDPSELLIIRREISREGKNRALINCQMVPLPILQAIGRELIDLIGQHSHQALRTSEQHRAIVDLFANAKEEILHFKEAWQEEKRLHEELETLLASEKKRQQELEHAYDQLKELESAQLKSGEEESLLEEHHRIAHTQELSEKIQAIVAALTSPLLPRVKQLRQSVNSLLAIDASLKEPADLFQEAAVALDETSHLLSIYLNKLEADPQRFLFLEERLAAIQKIKRKYGQSVEEIQAYQSELEKKVSLFENLDQEIEKRKKTLDTAASHTKAVAARLTEKRVRAAKELEALLTKSLRSLNMPHANLSIEVKPQPRSQMGEDQVHFWLQANKGEASILVKDSSSGGELSRLLLAIKSVLAEKNDTPTLIFDEIDANVGGETATIIGETLHALGRCRQVLCITHFPQVASKGDMHFRVLKEEQEGRTLARITSLSQKEREKELLRMLGGTNLLMRAKP